MRCLLSIYNHYLIIAEGSKGDVFPIYGDLHPRVKLPHLGHEVGHLLVPLFFRFPELGVIVQNLEFGRLREGFLRRQVILYSSVKRHPASQDIGPENLDYVLDLSSIVYVDVIQVLLPELKERNLQGRHLGGLVSYGVIGNKKNLGDEYNY